MGSFISALRNGVSDVYNNTTGALWDSVVVVAATFAGISVANMLTGGMFEMLDVFGGTLSLMAIPMFAAFHVIMGIFVNSTYDFMKFAV